MKIIYPFDVKNISHIHYNKVALSGLKDVVKWKSLIYSSAQKNNFLKKITLSLLKQNALWHQTGCEV